MSHKLISEATLTTPRSGDMIPMARPGDTTARCFTYDNLVPTTVVANVKGFGAVGDGVTDDTAAIQAALDEAATFASGMNKYVHIYFPTGRYRVNSSLNMTNRRYFMIKGDGWGLSQIVSYATNRPALDLLGARYFDIRDISIVGDSTNTPSCAIFLGRTTTGPNCGNCFIDNISLDGTFSAAAIYNVSSEIIHIRGLRSGTTGVSAPYIYWVGITNGLSVVSDYDSISYTYTGATTHQLSDWWVNGGTGTNAVRLGYKCHNVHINNIYANIYGGTGYFLVLESETGGTQSLGMYIHGLGGEGSYAGGIKANNYLLKYFTFDGIALLGANLTGSTFMYGQFENNGGTNGTTVTLDANFYHVEFKRWYNYSNDSLTLTYAEGCWIDRYSSGAVITFTTDGGGNIVRDMDSVPHEVNFRSAAISFGSGANIRGIFFGTATLDFGSIAAGGESTLSVTCVGSTNDCFAFASPRWGSLESGLVIKSAGAITDAVNVTLRNVTGSAIDPGARAWFVCAIRGPT